MRAAAARLQVAALCWRRSRKGLRVLLITSRDTGRWVIPKGWQMRNRSDPDAARRYAVKAINRLKRKEEVAPSAPPPPTKEEVLLTEIRDILKSK